LFSFAHRGQKFVDSLVETFHMARLALANILQVLPNLNQLMEFAGFRRAGLGRILLVQRSHCRCDLSEQLPRYLLGVVWRHRKRHLGIHIVRADAIFVEVEGIHLGAGNDAHSIHETVPHEVLHPGAPLLLQPLTERRQAPDPVESLPVVADEFVLNEVHHRVERSF